MGWPRIFLLWTCFGLFVSTGVAEHWKSRSWADEHFELLLAVGLTLGLVMVAVSEILRRRGSR